MVCAEVSGDKHIYQEGADIAAYFHATQPNSRWLRYVFKNSGGLLVFKSHSGWREDRAVLSKHLKRQCNLPFPYSGRTSEETKRKGITCGLQVCKREGSITQLDLWAPVKSIMTPTKSSNSAIYESPVISESEKHKFGDTNGKKWITHCSIDGTFLCLV